jgi:flavin reductase (DIM6/NTAB) family NADH-FMN oxidoreductase RutF
MEPELPAVDPDTFRAVLGRFATGVTVLTVRDDQGHDCGMTVSAFASVSLRPPMVLACIGHEASMFDAISRAPHFAVSILERGQEALSRHFADTDARRFATVAVERAPVTGLAVIAGAIAWLECRIVQRVPAGDHTIIVGEVISAVPRGDHPLLYYRGGYAQLDR